MSVATDTARVGSLVGSPSKKRLTAASTILALVAVVVAAAMVAPNVGGGTPALTGIDPQLRNYHGVVAAGPTADEIRQMWIEHGQALNEFYGLDGAATQQTSDLAFELPGGQWLTVGPTASPSNQLPLMIDILPITPQLPHLAEIGDAVAPSAGAFLPEPYATYAGIPTNGFWQGTNGQFVERPGQPR